MEEYLAFINELNELELKIFIFRKFFKLNGIRIAKLLNMSQRQSYRLCKTIDNQVYFQQIKLRLIEQYQDANSDML